MDPSGDIGLAVVPEEGEFAGLLDDDERVASPIDAGNEVGSSTSGESEPEYSSDSGKGHSVMNESEEGTLTGEGDDGALYNYAVAMIYEFEIPQHLTGRLIGRFGSFVNAIKTATGATIMIKRHYHSGALKICAVEGKWRGGFW